MRIVLVEERDGQQRQERIYDHPTVRVGRDPAECNLVFNQSEWPMVSRRHAEFRFKNGRCLLVDTNSSFGTFLNGRRINEPAEIQPGARVQFGAGGPLMIVARIEMPQPQPPVNLAEMETRRDLPDVAGPDDVTKPRTPQQKPQAAPQPPVVNAQPPQIQQAQPPQRPPAPPQQPFAQPPYGQPPYAPPQGQPPYVQHPQQPTPVPQPFIQPPGVPPQPGQMQRPPVPPQQQMA